MSYGILLSILASGNSLYILKIQRSYFAGLKRMSDSGFHMSEIGTADAVLSHELVIVPGRERKRKPRHDIGAI